ncbi:MAG TPA: hypothetical protein VNL92_02480 [Dehalococcoidia bacterium]|nr:hypothetical protein [Dehalococcoidia bacterium]
MMLTRRISGGYWWAIGIALVAVPALVALSAAPVGAQYGPLQFFLFFLRFLLRSIFGRFGFF